MLRFYSGGYTALTVFLSMEPDMRAAASLTDGQTVLRKTASRFVPLQFPLEADREYTLHTDGAAVALAYLHGGADMERQGIYFLQAKKPKYRLHFSPGIGHLGGPAALCFYKGKYHLFYRWNPFADEEKIACMGHAAGESLFHMHSLPLLFLPPAELTLSRYRTGDIFDAKALAEAEAVTLYFTRRIYDYNGRCLSSGRMYVKTRDMLHFSEEEPYDEPCAMEGVQSIGDGVYLCTRDENGQAVQMRLVREKECTPFLYADFFQAGRSHALITATADSAGAWYRGTLNTEKFRIRSRGEIDWGEFCAPQTFLAENRRIIMGKAGENAVSLPREIESRCGRLYMRPLEEIYARFGGDRESDAFLVRMAGEDDMTARVGPLWCERRAGEIKLKVGEKIWRIPLAAREIEFFFDGDIAEVFINSGEAVCTIPLPAPAKRCEMTGSPPWTMHCSYLKG